MLTLFGCPEGKRREGKKENGRQTLTKEGKRDDKTSQLEVRGCTTFFQVAPLLHSLTHSLTAPIAAFPYDHSIMRFRSSTATSSLSCLQSPFP
mmetsp:Transcript_13045/g.25565  ORF Transcript_13045/g.25565 Transcript_13045/m.25565 type:complete len:93 (-) Transcript_13045:2456-2734(-)